MNRHPTVYVVDDDSAVRDALSMLLEQHGFQVAVFDSAEAFLEIAQTDSRGCAIVDLHMGGMDGLELQAEMARRGLALAVIVLTGHGDIPASVKAISGRAIASRRTTSRIASASVRSVLRNFNRAGVA